MPAWEQHTNPGCLNIVQKILDPGCSREYSPVKTYHEGKKNHFELLAGNESESSVWTLWWEKLWMLGTLVTSNMNELLRRKAFFYHVPVHAHMHEGWAWLLLGLFAKATGFLLRKLYAPNVQIPCGINICFSVLQAILSTSYFLVFCMKAVAVIWKNPHMLRPVIMRKWASWNKKMDFSFSSAPFALDSWNIHTTPDHTKIQYTFAHTSNYHKQRPKRCLTCIRTQLSHQQQPTKTALSHFPHNASGHLNCQKRLKQACVGIRQCLMQLNMLSGSHLRDHSCFIVACKLYQQPLVQEYIEAAPSFHMVFRDTIVVARKHVVPARSISAYSD